MKRKIVLLITACIVTVAALAAIQSYFIYNTYKLKEREVTAAISQKLLSAETDGKLDTLNELWMTRAAEFIVAYKAGKKTREQFVYEIAQMSDSLSSLMPGHIKKERFLDYYDVSYSNYISSVVVLDKFKANDTVFKGRLLLFGNNTEDMKQIPASQSAWTGNTVDHLCNVTPYEFQVKTNRFYSIPNWEREVLWKMSGLLAFSIALFIIVIGLFYWSIKNLITQRKIADIKTDFINNITHEFQTPLAALDIAVSTLKKEGELSHEHLYNSLSIIDRQNQRMQKLFRQVAKASVGEEGLDISRAENLTATDVQHIIDDFKLSRPEANISFTADEGTAVHMDHFHLSTVLVNLLDNAVKYGADKIKVRLAMEDNRTQLMVSDNGRGIASKEKSAIFEKFYRVDKGNVHTTKGLGLGLFYVRQIVTAYNGSVTVTNEEGQGSTFTLAIPS